MMNKKQFVKGIMALESVYDNFRVLNDEKTAKVWYTIFKDDNHDLFVSAIETYIATNEYKPTPAGIRKSMEKLINSNNMNGAEAWRKATQIIQNYGIYRAEEALEKIKETDNLLYKAMKTIGYRELCLSENRMADRAHFLKIYEQYSKREYDKAMIPKEIQRKIASSKTSMVTNKLCESLDLNRRLEKWTV